MNFSIINCGSSLIRGTREILGCIQQCVDILFTCRIMDQMPSNNLGKAVDDYSNCLQEKCCSCPTTKSNIEMQSNNNAPLPMVMAANIPVANNPDVNLMGSLPTNSEQPHSDDW